jgi:hypothetical protein
VDIAIREAAFILANGGLLAGNPRGVQSLNTSACGLISPSTVFSRLAKVPFGKSLGWLLQGSCGNTGQQRA